MSDVHVKANISFILPVKAIIKTRVVSTATLMQTSREHWNLNFLLQATANKITVCGYSDVPVSGQIIPESLKWV